MEVIGYWVAGVAVGISLLLVVVRSYNNWVHGYRKRLPPGEMGWPLVGESTELFGDFGMGGKPNMFINRRIAKYGKLPCYTTHLFGGPTIILPTFEGIKLVLSSPELFNFGLPNPEQILGVDSFSLFKGERRKRFREILMEALAGPGALKNVAPVMDSHTKRILKEAAPKDSFDMFELCKALTQASEMEIFFGPFDQEVFDLFADVFNKFLEGLFGFAINLPGFSRYEAIKGRIKVEKWLEARVEQRRAEGKIHETDAMGYLMNTVDETGKKLSDHVIAITLFNFFTASQSTFRPLFWILFYLSKNPQFIPELRKIGRFLLRERLSHGFLTLPTSSRTQEEHQKIAAKKNGEPLTNEDIRQLPFTQKAWDETLRLLNLFPFLFRIANVDVDFHGITIPKGWKALAYLRALHMDPKKFPDPEAFNPHRWNDPKTQVAPFLPFGHGKSICPGKTQAQFQAFLFLHNLVLNYNWEFIEPESPVRFLPEAKPANCMARLIPLM